MRPPVFKSKEQMALLEAHSITWKKSMKNEVRRPGSGTVFPLPGLNGYYRACSFTVSFLDSMISPVMFLTFYKNKNPVRPVSSKMCRPPTSTHKHCLFTKFTKYLYAHCPLSDCKLCCTGQVGCHCKLRFSLLV